MLLFDGIAQSRSENTGTSIEKIAYFLSIADIAVIFFCQTESSLLGKHLVRLGIIRPEVRDLWGRLSSLP